jgi:hypothetical protein
MTDNKLIIYSFFPPISVTLRIITAIVASMVLKEIRLRDPLFPFSPLFLRHNMQKAKARTVLLAADLMVGDAVHNVDNCAHRHYVQGNLDGPPAYYPKETRTSSSR